MAYKQQRPYSTLLDKTIKLQICVYFFINFDNDVIFKIIEITTLHSLIILAFEDTPLATTIALKFEQRGFKLCFWFSRKLDFGSLLVLHLDPLIHARFNSTFFPQEGSSYYFPLFVCWSKKKERIKISKTPLMLCPQQVVLPPTGCFAVRLFRGRLIQIELLGLQLCCSTYRLLCTYRTV